MRSALKHVKWTDLQRESKVFPESSIDAGFWGTDALDDATKSFRSPKQIHSSDIISADDCPDGEDQREGDGIFTRVIEKTVAVKTADCLPLLFAAPKDQLVMAVHAGWRGLSNNIVKHAVMKSQSLGISSGALSVSLGPCISAPVFEVGPEVIEAFEKNYQETVGGEFYMCVSKGISDRWHFDLSMYAVQSLIHLGVSPEKIRVFRHCTFTESSRWSSYRREKQTGRNWSWIKLKNRD